MTSILRLLAGACIALLISGCDGGEQQPATQPVPPDLSTPTAAAKAFALAIAHGDIATAKAVSLNSKESDALLDEIGAMKKAMDHLHAAALAKFGDMADPLANRDAIIKSAESLDLSDAVIDGDKATITPRGKEGKMRLKKIEAQWKVDYATMNPPEKLLPLLIDHRSVTKATYELAVDVTAGKFKTVAELAEASKTRLVPPVQRQLQQRQAPEVIKGGRVLTPAN